LGLSHAIFLDRLRRLDGDAVVRLIAAVDVEVVVFQGDIQVGKNQFLLDYRPHDPGHFVSVHIDKGSANLDFVLL
jgi:hypothetical protein